MLTSLMSLCCGEFDAGLRVSRGTGLTLACGDWGLHDGAVTTEGGGVECREYPRAWSWSRATAVMLPGAGLADRLLPWNDAETKCMNIH